MKDGEDNGVYDPTLTLLNKSDDVLLVEFVEYGLNTKSLRGVPVKYIETVDGKKIPAVTVYDLTFGQYGVGRGLPGDYPKDYNDKNAAYTPAWQEIFTGIGRDTVLQLAREWGILLK